MGDFRSLRAWQAADRLALGVFHLADANWSPKHACVWDQLRRAALSVSLNLAEGHAQGPGARCRFHFRVSYGSAVETRVLLDFLSRLGIETTELLSAANETRALTYRLWQRSR
jgi:four helix bundle protein